MKEVVWGMIGTGDVTEKKSGPGLYKAKGSRLKAVYNRTQERAESWTERHGHGVVYDTVEKIMNDPEITAVYIATPPASHFDYAMQVIAAGKIPFIEKPMASTYEECRQIIDAANEKNLPVYVSFYRRALDKFQKIHTLLEDGAIGKPILVEIRQFQPPQKEELQKENIPWRLTPEAGGGKALDLQVHVLDYLASYFGDIQEMKGIVDNRGELYLVEDTISASFQFENGVIGSATWSYVADVFLDEVTIIGTNGRLVFAGMNVESVTLIKRGQEETYDFDSPKHITMPLIQTIVDEIRGIGKSPADAESAANGIKMFDQLLKEYRQRY
ncbi:Gfo/Idh/MocA family oxidoreductase [Jeotgalibaca sp. MA1X17-3]|uniref:Gfo/Idh/MocA family protein n=1 Tax=Jeotgalibaca sp. MA1X17-3 TaxID=2908211 RepID=UPI001F1C4958|nr:Gfo/Idh/MocA family oxidoreductase [Jeotgalibaca sp. MA1X17-3]UJF15330.1 Gfo/Idh/MocA family oxidoreductase [Jeotgalibaca sp. MA1X17-3]